jgi:hypothetical protein
MRRVLLGGLLLASLTLNGVLLAMRRSSASPAARPAPSARTAAPAPERTADATCARDLERCRDQGWELARKVLAAEAKHAPPAPALRAPADVGARDQSDALCAKAKTALGEQWRKDHDAIVSGLRRSLDDAGEQAQNVEKVAGELGDLLHLDAPGRRALADEYRRIRLARIATAREALARTPPDLDAVFLDARTLFADEDALASRFGGEAGRLAVRGANVDGRTVILALLASLAERELEDATGW